MTNSNSQTDKTRENRTELIPSILSIFYQNFTIGISKFKDKHLEILTHQHCPKEQMKSIVTSIILSASPNIILCSSKSCIELLSFLKQFCNDKNGNNLLQNNYENSNFDEDDHPSIIPNYTLEVRPNIEFKFENSKNILLSLQLPSKQSPLAIANCINIDYNKESVSSAGAILSYLSKDSFGLDGQIEKISAFSLDSMMQLSLETIYSLSIFEENRSMPSLFKFLDQTKTSPGREMLKSWFLAPLQTISAISERQGVVSFFLNPANYNLIGDLQKELSKISNIPKVMHRLRVKSVVNDWNSLHLFLVAFIHISAIISKQTHRPQLLDQLIDKELNSRFEELTALLTSKIDFQESSSSHRIIICQYVDAELDEMKRFYHAIESFLTSIATKIQLQGLEFQVVYMVSLGFLIKMKLPIISHPDLIFQFQSENDVFYKNSDMNELDDKIGDIHSQIIDRELEIVQEIREEIMDIAEDISYATVLISELDCLISFAKSSMMYNYTKPEITDTDCLLLEKMRHPILEHLEDRFVMNDIGLGFYEDQILPKALLITGPNASGKSVYLHQVALIVYMAHLGCFVPCEFAVIGLTDKILTRIRTKTSVSLRESTFQSDLNQACMSIVQSTPKSLVLLDEFGKGTSSSDGVGLFAASVAVLCEKKTRLLAATHFHEVFSFPEFLEIDGLAFYTLETMMTPGECPEFLYHLIPGRSISSMGILCAENNGIKEPILARARMIAEALERGEPIPILKPRKDMEDKAFAVVTYFLKLDLSRQDSSLDLDHFFKLLSSFEKTL